MIYGYCRVSTLRQASEGESLDVQRRQIEGYALMHGLAARRNPRRGERLAARSRSRSGPVGRALFARLASGDVIIAAKLDRLFRSALDALKVVEDLRKRGVALHLLDLGGDISGNGMSKLFLTIAAAFAEAERDRIRERIGQAKADQKARGRYLGGTCRSAFGAATPASSSRSTPSKRRFAKWSRCGSRGGRSGRSRRPCGRRASKFLMRACGRPYARTSRPLERTRCPRTRCPR